jgi:hypothetical protein
MLPMRCKDVERLQTTSVIRQLAVPAIAEATATDVPTDARIVPKFAAFSQDLAITSS